jgi:CDGSH iron-sulfur domain-containing protein 3
MPTARLKLLRDGPYELNGDMELVDEHGRALAAPDPTVYLCRCGLSARKPFCDGSHARTGGSADTSVPGVRDCA